ncbi:hypothetical protein [Deminuibacter soli]|uniref:Glycosyltransferase n=1 Tax=Deminuibacter soli TaxID=2291815 RepID=A0A3E1NFA7_9BACT|nr:hypothetical protein [Deminuibacter soli]RFM26665.1 hypothetical protein DXN05_19035 [Deminuibacter soli]
MKIVVADFYRAGKEHYIFNASLVKICTQLADVTAVRFIADSHQTNAYSISHGEEDANGVTLKALTVPAKVGGKHWIKKIGFEIIQSFRLLCASSTEETVIFSSLSPVTSVFVKFFGFLWKGKNVLITLHGDVDFIQQNKTGMRNLLGKCFKASFRIKRKNVKYLALSFPISNNLIKEHYLNSNELFWINHPYFFKKHSLHKEPGKPVRIGHIGVASQEKHTHYIFDVAQRLATYISNGALHFSLVGMAVNISDFSNGYVEGGNTAGEMLSKEQFDKKIEELDYAVFFYSDEHYKFCSSGAILDAINHEIPVIALKTEGFSYIFSKAAGRMGFLCNDLNEMTALIEDITNGKVSKDEYDDMRNTIADYKHQFSIEYVKDQLVGQKGFIDFIKGNR